VDKLIILDPGHGGEDPGATREGVLEKDINLNVALLVGKILNPGLASRGYRIGYIRANDMTIELTDRPKLAAIEKPNAYVSIHCNAVINPKAFGIETWYPQYSIRSKTLASFIQDKASENIYVLKKATYPATLIEMGFLSNPTERRLLSDPAYQQSLAGAIAEGIDAYFRSPISKMI
jgi:N-acetylmuramoyl-L-alanine amidase